MWRAGPFTLPRLLLCEGPDDESFFEKLIERRNIQRFHISDTSTAEAPNGGNSGFRRGLIAARLNGNYASVTKILVVSDNDADPAASFRNVCDQIEAAGFPRPPAPLTPTPGRPSITVMMIPLDDDERGNLETICVPAARSTDAAVAGNVDHFAALMRSNRWVPERVGKFWLRSFLAAKCRRDPFVFLGKVFRDHPDLIPLDHASLTPIADVLSAL